MNGSAIQALVEQDASGGVLTLKAGANALGSTRIDALLTDAFGGTLVATLGSAQVGADSVAYPAASLQCTRFAFYDKSVQVRAALTISTGSGGALDLSVSAAMPDSWALTDSFTAIAALPGSAINQLLAASGTIALDSADSASDAVVTAALTTAGSALAQLTWLLGATVTVSGAASFVSGPDGVAYPQLSLSSPPIAGPDISGFGFDVSANIRAFAGPPALADGSWPLLTSVDLTVDLVTPALTLPILISVTGAAQTRYPVSLDPYAPAPTITSLSQLQGFTWGQTVQLSSDTPIGTLSLKSLSLIFDAAGRSLGSLQVSVDLDTGWTPVPNLELKGLDAQLFVPVVWGGKPPGTTTASFSLAVTAELLIATASINVIIAYPEETITLALAPATVVDINAFLDALAPGVSLPGTGDLLIEGLDAVADIGAQTYSVSASADGELSVIPGFVLTSIDTAMTWAKSSVQAFQFGAGFTIADAPLSMLVAYAPPDWSITGGSAPGQPIDLTALIADIASIFGVQLPSTVPEMVLSPLEMTYATGTGDFTFNATITVVPGDDPILTKLSGTVDIAYDGVKQAWTGLVSGSVVIDATNTFTALYDFKTDQVISLSWTASGDETLGINDLATLFGASGPQDLIPPDLDLALVQVIGKYDITTQQVIFECKSKTWGVADVAVWRDAADGWKIYLGVDIDTSISLSDIPLVGKALTSAVGEVALTEIQAAVVNGALTAQQAGALAKLIDAGYPTPPAAGMPTGAALVMVFDAGGSTTRIGIGTPTSSTPPAPAPPSQLPVPAAPGGTGVATGSDGTKWFSIQKSFGPVSIQKVGVRYSGGKLWALMNVSVAAGGLEIEALGLGVGSPLTTFEPSFTVDGIVVSLAEGPVKFSGGLVGSLDPLNLYGEIGVDFGPFSIGAIAGYAEYEGDPSFFLYGVLDAPLGGPGFFFVTGLAAGFGFNRSLIVPDVSGVYQFPLVQWAVGINAPSADPAGDIGAQVASTMASLTTSGVIAPNIGEYWFAAGIRFTSYELVDSFALATFAFGNELEIDLLGLSTVAVPPAPASPVAEAQLALKATIQPSTGLIGISGQLTPNSYVLSKSCQLTGGFAVYLWVSGPYAGQFVMTLGGYSPKYDVPSYYPVVPRLGLQWTISDCLTVTGDLYFALTSSAVMAGGGLSAVWQAGDIRAWFDVETDFLMVFTPFHYYLSGSIELGASVRISLIFTHVTISIHLGVGVEIWGPSFSGEIDVDLSIVSFTISFGSGQQGQPNTIAWNDFVAQLLPSQPATTAPPPTLSAPQHQRTSLMRAKPMLAAAAPTPPPPAVIQIVARAGVLQTLSTVDGDLNWLVDGQTFSLQVQTNIPLTAYTLDGPGVVLATTGQPPTPPNTTFGCGPAGVSTGDLTSTMELSAVSVEDSWFSAVLLQTSVATALWQDRSFDSHGTPQDVDPVNGTTIDNVLTGFVLTPTTTPPDQTPLPIPLQYLQYTIDPAIQSFTWSVPVVATSNPFTSSQTVASTIEAAPATSNRPTLLAAMKTAGLAVAQTVDVSTLAANSNYLLAQPVAAYLGEAV